MAVLALDRRYSDVQPRRPKGGPDGSRDIEAVYNGAVRTWAAVGFRNQVSDSPEDKRAIKAKFKSDLDTAIAENQNLRGFAFLTNVDLTPAEGNELTDHARQRGLIHVDVFWRERIRVVLDSPEGLGIRYQYLQIPLSDAEQASFFSRFGSDLQSLLNRQHEAVGASIARVEFRIDGSRPLTDFLVHVVLKNRIPAEAVKDFRLFVELPGLVNSQNPRNVCVAVRDDHHKLNFPAGPRQMVSVKAMSGDGHKFSEAATQDPGVVTPHLDGFGATFDLNQSGLVKSLSDLDNRLLRIFLSDSLAREAARIVVAPNGYTFLNLPHSEMFLDNHRPSFDWPRELGDDTTTSWLSISKRGTFANGATSLGCFFRIDFAKTIPPRFTWESVNEQIFQLPVL